MFRRQVVIALLLLGLIGGAATFGLVQINEADRAHYDHLLDQSVNGTASTPDIASTQTREGVVKEMWMSTAPARLHFRLVSENSELVISEEAGQQRAVEHMEGVTGYMQEELFYQLPDGRRAHQAHGGLYRISGEPSSHLHLPGDDWIAMQEIRYLQAEKASFDYTIHHFAAHEVTMVRFEAEGHTLPEGFEEIAPVMSGTAKTVEFTLNGDKLDFYAHRLQAKIFSQERLL